MFHLKPKRILSKATCAIACVFILAEAGAQANAAVVTRAAETKDSEVANSSSAHPFLGDDPVSIRDRMVNRSTPTGAPSLGDRVLGLIHSPTSQRNSDSDLMGADLSRDLTFVVAVPYGIRYNAEKHQLTVNVDLSGDDPAGIVLRKTIRGPSGRRLVVAPEARSKGFIQNIEIIEIDAKKNKKTTVHGRVILSPEVYAEANGDFAIAIMGNLVPPYFSDRIDHSDPTDDEPTDITTRTSRLYVAITAVWLISPQRGMVLSKALRLSK